jgi:hypothetical protein
LSLDAYNLSIILSTAIFEGAQAKTLALYIIILYNISSTTVVVFPVPGGPCINDTSSDAKHFLIASFYDSFIPLLKKFKLLYSVSS